jgi:hypothetical protein
VNLGLSFKRLFWNADVRRSHGSGASVVDSGAKLGVVLYTTALHTVIKVEISGFQLPIFFKRILGVELV